MIIMEANKIGIKYTVHPPQKIASIRTTVTNRSEILNRIMEFLAEIPKEYIQGKPFCIFYYVTSALEGFDVEYGVPVHSEFPSNTINFRTTPKMESFSILHKGKLGDIGKAYGIVFKYAYKFGYPSQEFSREEYKHIGGGEGNYEIEVQFIIHPWNKLLVDNVMRVLGAEQKANIMEGLQAIEIETPLDKKFEWLVGMLKKLEEATDEAQRYDIISSCAHFFPEDMIFELKQVYEKARKTSSSILDAVDETLKYMETHKGWGSIPVRNGEILYTTKNPQDPKAFKEAKTHIERLKAYCYCPIIRNFLGRDIPVSFCNCGAGWVKQLWEGVFNQHLKIELVKSLTAGKEECQFAIHIPKS
jgi:effector-binding domain-containing protein